MYLMGSVALVSFRKLVNVDVSKFKIYVSEQNCYFVTDYTLLYFSLMVSIITDFVSISLKSDKQRTSSFEISGTS
jgi:hypothetical protein